MNNLEVKNRVTYNLPGSVKCNISSPVDFIKGSILCFQLDIIEKQVILRTASSKRINIGMLNKNQCPGMIVRAMRLCGFIALLHVHKLFKERRLIIPCLFIIF